MAKCGSYTIIAVPRGTTFVRLNTVSVSPFSIAYYPSLQLFCVELGLELGLG